MKKKLAAWLTATVMLVLMSLSVSAESKFVDIIEDGFAKAESWSDHMCYQYNDDMECSILVKQSDTNSPTTTEHIIYKMNSDITGFSLNCMHVNGLGNGVTDLKVYVSPDKTNWNEIPLKATEQVFDEEVYINFDLAYWLQSVVSNKNNIPAGNSYIKIEIQPFTVAESCTWNTVINTVTVNISGEAQIGGTTTPGSQSQDSQLQSSQESSPSDLKSSGTDAKNSSTVSASSDHKETAGKKTAFSGIVVLIVSVSVVICLAAVGTAVFFILKSKKAVAAAGQTAQLKEDKTVDDNSEK